MSGRVLRVAEMLIEALREEARGRGTASEAANRGEMQVRELQGQLRYRDSERATYTNHEAALVNEANELRAQLRDANAASASAEERGYKRGLLESTPFPEPGSADALKLAIRVLSGHPAVHRRPNPARAPEWLLPEGVEIETRTSELLRQLDELLPNGDV